MVARRYRVILALLTACLLGSSFGGTDIPVRHYWTYQWSVETGTPDGFTPFCNWNDFTQADTDNDDARCFQRHGSKLLITKMTGAVLDAVNITDCYIALLKNGTEVTELRINFGAGNDLSQCLVTDDTGGSAGLDTVGDSCTMHFPAGVLYEAGDYGSVLSNNILGKVCTGLEHIQIALSGWRWDV
jgi:hypothetical protein